LGHRYASLRFSSLAECSIKQVSAVAEGPRDADLCTPKSDQLLRGTSTTALSTDRVGKKDTTLVRPTAATVQDKIKRISLKCPEFTRIKIRSQFLCTC